MIMTGTMALVFAGCGDSSGTPTNPEGGKTAAPPPRPGEDVMKEQMLRLQKKGAMPNLPGLPKNNERLEKDP